MEPRLADMPDGAPGADAVMPSLIAGRYEVRRLLGEGGRKRVFLAYDPMLDREVAVALLKTDGLDEAGVARIRREARSMGRLGDHPNIVTVHDIGEEGSRSHIVSQYMAGGSAADLLATEGRLPVEQVLAIGADLARALAHAHAAGILHRDVKPGNVFFTASGVAKLGDFGLATGPDRSSITLEGLMVGTAAYMPPEQAMGAAVDATSDLYSLGATLYHLATGRPPFPGEDPVAVISQHLHAAAVAPSWHNPQIPAALESLILRLLAKRPEERPRSAEAVAGELAGIRPDAAPAPEESPAAANPLDRLARRIFVGRAQEVERLRARVEDALAGHGSVALLAGEPGIGKTALADEVATYARLRGARVLWGRCYEDEGAPAYWPWVQVIRAHASERAPDELAAEMGAGASDIAQVVSEIRERLPSLPPAPPAEPEHARFRLFDSVARFLRGASRERPMVLVLDDLHSADRPSLLLLAFVAREAGDAALMIVGTYRSGEIEERGVADAIAAVARQPAATTLHLAGLSPEDVGRLIEMTAGAAPRDAVVRTILEETEGNPLFVKEVVNLLAGTGRLGAVTETTSRSLEIPEGVLGVLRRRVDRLSEHCRELLQIAAVAGREFGIGVLERVSGAAPADALALVEEALDARVVAEVPGVLGRYSFSHALVRQILYSDLPAARRRDLHRSVGEALEGVYGESSERHLPELAHHFLEAAPAVDGTKAIGYAVRAAERANAQLAYEDAAALYERALQLGELAALEDAMRIDLLLVRAASLTRAGDTARAREVCGEAAALARETGDPTRLARAALAFGEAAGTAMWTDFWVPNREPLDLLDEALARLPDEAATAGLRAQLLARMASELASDLDPSAPTHREQISAKAVRLAEEAGDPATIVRALAARHLAAWTPDNLDERLRLAAEVAQLARDAGERELELSGHAWLLCDHLEVGDVAAADRDIEAYARLAAELREPRHLAQVTLFRALRALFGGRFEECDRLGNESAATARRVGDERTALSAEALLFTLRYWQGALTDFEGGLEALLAVFPPGPASRSSVACAYLGIGRAEDAKREYEALAAHDFADVPRDAFWLGTIARSAMVCSTLKDQRRGEILYEMLRPFAGRNIVGGRDVEDCSGSAAAFAGLLAEMLGHADEAAGLFEQAIEMNERMGARLWLTLSRLYYAQLLLGSGTESDRVRALGLATTAAQTAQEVGAPALVQWATGVRMLAQGIQPTDTLTSIDAVAAAVEAERPGLGSHTAPDGTVTILFTDIEGSTSLTEQLGDRRWLELLQEHNALIREQVRAHGGLEVKSRGDGFMLVFPSARQALAAAVGIQHALAIRNASAPEPAIRVRIGLHTGEAVQDSGDFFGTHVNMAARIADLARGDEILISGLTRQLVAGFREFAFGESRDVQLKGLSSTHQVVAVDWAAAASA